MDYVSDHASPDIDSLAAVAHDVVDLGSVPFGLRIVKVRCDQDN